MAFPYGKRHFLLLNNLTFSTCRQILKLVHIITVLSAREHFILLYHLAWLAPKTKLSRFVLSLRYLSPAIQDAHWLSQK